MTAPDPQTVREIAQEIILKQANYWNAAEIRQDYRTDPRCARLSDEDFTDVRDAVINAIVDATVTVSWPHEQPGVEQAAVDHAMLLPWLAATRAEVERDHRPNAGILSTSCYCGCPEPCEDRAAELAAAADALADPTPAPRRPGAENAFNFADATLHAGSTAAPVGFSELEFTWEPPKPEPGRAIVGVDGNVIVTGTLATDGTITIQSTTTTVAPPRPPRRTQPPDRCPCTAIYSVCRCPDRR